MPAREPVTALDVLRTALHDHGVIACVREAGHDQVMLIAGRVIVLYRDGCFWWRTGRVHEGRDVLGIHRAIDPGGAARRVARLHHLTGTQAAR